MTALPILFGFDPARLVRLADWLVVAVAVSLPWSTSATAILIAVWLITILPTLDAGAIRRELATAAGGLPVLLWVLAAVGMLWADVSWAERIGGLGKFHRLLVIPLLLAQFRRSEHGALACYGFLASATCLLAVCWSLALIPNLSAQNRSYGVPVKDYILQSGIFLICAVGLIGAACECWRERKWRIVLLLLCFAALFLGNIAFVITSRTVFVVAPALVFVLGWRQFGLRGALAACLVAGVLAGALWFSSSTLRERAFHSIEELSVYRDTNSVYLNSNEMNSTGLHVEFLKKSLQIIEAAPFIGHGTGSIPDQFRRAATGKTDAAAVVTVNPHNQIFAVTIQLGLLGTVVLLAMWVSHFMLFRSGGITAWIGTIIVIQNVASSLFNSHLFDFTQGWLYVFGVGIAGGTALRVQRSASAVAKP